ncbi:large ribosomal subunit protein bL35m [Bacillus rossius redtenbacheri]|uniref:large ribosomal subunit protein bL35m n=1 Tax=Bacillus rossius redtenbacheri TaxID=93214 RepID=UPI002FDDD29F
MLRLVCGAVRAAARMKETYIQTANTQALFFRGLQTSPSYNFQAGSLVSGFLRYNFLNTNINSSNIVPSPSVLQSQSRTVTKFSRQKGKRRSVRAVVQRFYRLHWGGWIRTRAGRHRFLWKKKDSLKRRHRQHVFCNATQSRLLDKMVTKFWRKPRFYVDDPYEPYHTREEYYVTRKKPLP